MMVLIDPLFPAMDLNGDKEVPLEEVSKKNKIKIKVYGPIQSACDFYYTPQKHDTVKKMHVIITVPFIKSHVVNLFSSFQGT